MKVSPLHSAAASGYTAIVNLLPEQDADPNALQEGGFTPLHAAAQNGDVQTIHTLLLHSADVDIKSAEGKSPLNYAIESKNLEAVELIRKGITKRFRKY